jgi:hypothetical protein
MDLLRTANEWLQKTRKAYAASPVTYQRVSASASFPASYGRAEYTVTGSEGFTAVFESWDFLVDAADLELDGETTAPKVGDRVIVGELDDGLVYEVVNVPGGKCWRWSDSFQRTYRVHTKYVGVQPQQR